jgi:hypothetical protein
MNMQLASGQNRKAHKIDEEKSCKTSTSKTHKEGEQQLNHLFLSTKQPNEHTTYTTVQFLSLHSFTTGENAIDLLTPCSTVLLEKLTGLQLVKKFPAFYGNRRFLTALTSARHLSLS